jgi:hypothetical protein
MNSLPTGWIRSWLTVTATVISPHDFALPLRMPQVGFAVLFESAGSGRSGDGAQPHALGIRRPEPFASKKRTAADLTKAAL